MNLDQYLTHCLTEECSEVIKDCMKADHFGMDSFDPKDPEMVKNSDNIVLELNDILAVAELMVKNGTIPANWNTSPLALISRERKAIRTIRLMELSKKNGRLNKDITTDHLK